jgi:hypothetical protein
MESRLYIEYAIFIHYIEECLSSSLANIASPADIYFNDM